jgi:hypothetical protein
MLKKAQAHLKAGDSAEAISLLKEILKTDPENNSERSRRFSAPAGEEFLSRRSLTDIQSLIGEGLFALMGVLLLFWGIQAGWNGVSWGSSRSGRPVATSGKFLILSGLGCLGGGGGLLLIGVRRLRLR